MAGKGPPQRFSSSQSNRRTRWDTNNPPPDHISGDPKPSLSKDDPSVGPSKLPADPTSPPVSSGIPFPGPGAAPFTMPVSGGLAFPLSESGPAAPPPAYGFHMLERRTIVLADGSVRSYFALPPDSSSGRNFSDFPAGNEKFFPYGPGGPGPNPADPGGLGLERIGAEKHFPAGLSPEPGFRRDREGLLGAGGEPFGRGGGEPFGRGYDYWNSSGGLDGRPPENPLKRKYGEEGRDFMEERFGTSSRFPGDDAARQRQQLLLHYGNPNGFPVGRLPGSGERSDYLARNSSPLNRSGPDSGRGTDDLPLSKHTKLEDGFEDVPSRRSGPIEVQGNADDSPKRASGVSEVATDVNPQALRRAFLRISKTINENSTQRRNYVEDGKSGPLHCLVCGRSSKEFTDTHGLIMHAYNSQNTELRIDHLALHKAVCVMMGWNYAKAPENSKAYQSLSADEAMANKEDLIMWPPIVIIHNTNSGKRKDGRMEGMGNKEMDNKLKDLGFTGGKSKSLYGKEGHLGITMVKFANNQAGLKEAERLAEFFEKDDHGRKGWAHAQASQTVDDDEKNPNLVKVDEKSGEKKRIFYGYLGTALDFEKVDFDMKKKAVIKSRKDFDVSD